MKTPFEYRNGALHCEDVPAAEIAAQAGTPCFVYSAGGILARYREYSEAFGDIPHHVCYAVKANSNTAVLRQLAAAGAWFDIVSGGELFRVIHAGGQADRVVFSGVGKIASEVDYALASGIHSFNCESESELDLIDARARLHGTRARVSLRVNPDINPETHPKISTGLRENKFGIDIAGIERVYEHAHALPNLEPEGVSCHIGSQLMKPDPVMESAARMIDLVGRLRARGLPIRHLDLGGGLGVAYSPGGSTPSIRDFVERLSGRFAGLDLTIFVEPGRSIVAESGILLTQVIVRKRNQLKEFVVVDAAMNDLLRPTLYEAHHEIRPVLQRSGHTLTADIVGPVCETGDYLALGRQLPAVEPGDLLAVFTAGAYGFVMSSNYNARPRAAEVLVEGGAWSIARRRETYDDLVRGE
ncbi:MAG: diaminopimelate decarboxylase [Acidobacteria bacterium]|nr:diaminopimelate decarboxylase [Acidobacteriota bacterium]